jgi:hypothetical protein
VNPRAIEDPRYDGEGLGSRGFSLAAGPHHLGGWEALAYVRSRLGLVDSDFTRAARQQEVLVALRERFMGTGGNLFFQLPAILDIFGDTVRTDVPPSLLPKLALAADSIDGSSAVRVVIQKPLVKGAIAPAGYRVPNIARIRRWPRWSRPGHRLALADPRGKRLQRPSEPQRERLRDVATHRGHRGLIFRAPIKASSGVRPLVSRPVWARSSL